MSKKPQKQPKFLAVDFFCGAGGTTRGLIDAGGYVIAGIDKESLCEDTYTKNNRNKYLDKTLPAYLKRDIFLKTRKYKQGEQEELFTDLRRLIKEKSALTEEHIPMLFAICAPCQPFTRFSGELHTEDRKKRRRKDRNLLSEACKFVEKFKPEMVLSENVAGIKDKKYGNVWRAFQKQLEKLGYVTGTKIVCASNFGVAQYRRRSILVGVRKDLARSDRFADLEKTTLLVPDKDPDSEILTVKDVLKNFPSIEAGESHKEIPNHKARALSDLNLKRISCAKPGQNNDYLESTKYGNLSLACHKRVNKRLGSRCYSDVYTRMHPDRPSPTITTRCNSISNGRYGHYDVKQHRAISLREAAALQSFPDNYVFYPQELSEPIARMVGNAVPPRLSEFFGGYLVDSLKTG